MKKLLVEGVSYSQSNVGSYVIILTEDGGDMRIPIIVDIDPAEAVSLKLEGFSPARKKTYDFISKLFQNLDVRVISGSINSFDEGIFGCSIKLSMGDSVFDIPVSISDVIVISLCNDAELFIDDYVLDSCGIVIDPSGQVVQRESKKLNKPLDKSDLERELEKAISEEDYLKAAKLRDELNKF